MESASKHGSGGDDGEAAHSSWSAAIVADFENSATNDVPGIMSSSPSDEKENRRGGTSSSMDEARDGVASLASMEEKKSAPAAIDTATRTPPRIATSPSAEATHREHDNPSSPKSSPFRQSLDEEHRAKSRQRQMEDHRTEESKRLLRESVRSLSTARDDAGHEVLTRPERNFLELLLEDRGPGAGEACMAAHERLMDGNLFFWTMCGGAAGEVGPPGHGWTFGSTTAAAPMPPKNDIIADEDETPLTVNHKKINSGDDWVKDWVARGSQDSKGSQESRGSQAGGVKTQASGEKTGEETKKKGEGSGREPAKEDGQITMNGKEPVPVGFKTPHQSSHGSLSSNTNNTDAAAASVRPTHELQRKSSEARLARLNLRRKQSSSGLDNSNRLFRAHEAGLVVSQQGSARRSLMRMGLPMERGFFGASGLHQPPPMPLAEDLSRSKTDGEEDGKVDRNKFPSVGLDLAGPEAEGDAAAAEAESMNPAFQRALAKMDERTIRRIEKEERAKQKKATLADQGGHQLSHNNRPVSPLTADINPGGVAGCISPFSMSVLRRMFASKQFSFHRSSSSYTRFDSFLNSTTKSIETAGSGMLSDLDNSLRLENRKIFRPSPRPSSSGERLKNLLVNAGFKDDGSDDGVGVGEGGGGHHPVLDAKSDDDADILSQSTNSVAQLMRHGGPSYRNVDMFREASNDDQEKIAGVDDVDVLNAKSDDDADILSQSTNSVAQLMKGGPSYRNVDMFRESTSSDSREKKDKKMTKKKMNLTVQATNHNDSSSLFSSLGSPSSPDAGDVKESPSADVDVSPAGSDVGDLPISSLPPMTTSKVDRLSQSECTPRGRHRHHHRSNTVGIIKNSSVSSTKTDNNAGGKSSKSPPRPRAKYKRSVSWGHMVFSKDETKAALLARQESEAGSIASGMSVISFPNLRRAAPVQRSDSVASDASALLSIPPLRLGAHLLSESTTASVASMLSPVPSLSRAYPVFSPRPSFSSGIGPPLLTHANSVHSVVTQSDFRRLTLAHANSVHSIVRSGTTGTEIINDDDSLNSAEFVDARPDAPRGAAWESPRRPPRDPSRSTTSGSEDHPVFIRQASCSNYEGVGIEVEEYSPQVELPIDNARKLKSMVSLSDSGRSLGADSRLGPDSRYRSDRSLGGDSARYSQGGLSHGYSVHSSVSFGKSWRSVKSSAALRAAGRPLGPGPAIKSLDDSFVVRNINFERHSSEILRSLSNEDLSSSHHLETINGASSGGGRFNEASSVARVYGNLVAEDESWDLESSNSYAAAANAWGVLDDEYAEGYGAHDSLPFKILGTSANDTDCHPHVLSPPLMESLQNFMPPTISESNFWLKYSLVRDGASLSSLLRHIRGTKHTLIAIETVEGEVFGSFTSSPWRKNWNYYGSGEAFLWRMRRTRSERDVQYSVLDQAKLESELDIFYWTGQNDLVQYCTHDMIAVGGGSLRDEDDRDDQANEQRDMPPQSPACTKVDKGGFGLAIDEELLRGTSSSCGTFQSPPLSKSHADGSPFEILNIEVWTMTPCANVADAENLEMKTLFLESYSRE